MSDIVTRLRTWVHAVDAVPVSDLMDEAAGVIESLRADVNRQAIAIECYVASASAACREINQLKERLHDATAQSTDLGCHATGRGVCDPSD